MFIAVVSSVSIAEAGRTAMTDGIHLGGYLAAGFVPLGLLATTLIPKPAASENEQSRAAHV